MIADIGVLWGWMAVTGCHPRMLYACKHGIIGQPTREYLRADIPMLARRKSFLCRGVQVNMWSLAQGGTTGQQIGVHDAAVKSIRFIPEMNLVASASWSVRVSRPIAQAVCQCSVVGVGSKLFACSFCGNWSSSW